MTEPTRAVPAHPLRLKAKRGGRHKGARLFVPVQLPCCPAISVRQGAGGGRGRCRSTTSSRNSGWPISTGLERQTYAGRQVAEGREGSHSSDGSDAGGWGARLALPMGVSLPPN